MLGSDIITRFNLQIDDASELSDSETLDIANEVYEDICNDRPWEWLKSSYSGSTSASVPYIALPSDFKLILPNYSGLSSGSFNNLGVPSGYRPSSYASFANQAVVFVGTTLTPYTIIPHSERRNYLNQDGFVYIDPVNSRLVFTLQPTEVKTVEYDYIKIPAAIEAGTSPLFRSGFHKIIPYGMAARFNPIEGTDKNESYQKENQESYDKILADMAVEDAEAKLAYT
jgi:hypothetical protein